MFLGFTARLLLDVNNTIFPILPTTSAWKVFSTRMGMGNDISERTALALLRVHGTHYEHALLGFIARLGGRGLYIFLLSGCRNRETKERHTDGQHEIRLPTSQYWVFGYHCVA